MTTCYCDYDEPPSLYQRELRTARKEHRCKECRRRIQPGERYERVFGIWGGDPDVYNTCPHCLALRDHITAHVPCFCWNHSTMLDDAESVIEHYRHESPELAAEVATLRAAIEGARTAGGVAA